MTSGKTRISALARLLSVGAILLAAACQQSASGANKERAPMTSPDVRHVSVAIDRTSREVYEFASRPDNLPRWAQGLAGSIEQVGGEWVAQSPMGKVKVRFTDPNTLGVLDHDVTLESGVSVHNPMRVVARPGGRSEVVFTVFRRPEVSDAEFESDTRAVQRDLEALKSLLE